MLKRQWKLAVVNKNECELEIGGKITIQVVKGDITQEEVDCIVCPTNVKLIHDGGVSAAISKKAGPEM